MTDNAPMVGSPEHGIDQHQGSGLRQARVTSVRKAVVVAGLVAIVAGGASSLATARLTDRGSDLDAQHAEITLLAGRVNEQETEIARLTSEAGGRADEVDRLNAENAALEGQILVLGAERTSLEEQLSQVLNPAPGPAPAASLSASWVERYGYGGNAVCVEIENTSEGEVSISYSSFQFSAIDGDNFVYPSRQHTPGYGIQLLTPLMNGELAPGEKRRGELLYDVPAQAVLTMLVWNTGFGETPEISIDLPAEGVYTSSSQC